MPDFRFEARILYPLPEILFAALCGVVCGASDYEEIHDIAEERIEFLREFYPYANGLPHKITIERTFRAIEPWAFEFLLTKWARSLIPGEIKGVVAMDGKRMRGSAEGGVGGAHIVSAFAHEYGLTLAQRTVGDKSNEIPALRELLAPFVLEGAIVTADAMHCQKETAQAIRETGADYLLALKDNQKDLRDDVSVFLKEQEKTGGSARCEETDAGHGRVEIRECLASEDIEWLRESRPDWRDLRSVAMVRATRIDKKTGEESVAERLFISSLPADAKQILHASRAHWSVENNLHWVLDVTFREDASQVKKDAAPQNLAALNRITLNLLKKENDPNRKKKLSIKRKRLKATMDPEFMKKIISQ
jgi:predicted transposase YbfD/YdcC